MRSEKVGTIHTPYELECMKLEKKYEKNRIISKVCGYYHEKYDKPIFPVVEVMNINMNGTKDLLNVDVVNNIEKVLEESSVPYLYKSAGYKCYDKLYLCVETSQIVEMTGDTLKIGKNNPVSLSYSPNDNGNGKFITVL
jgi:hypothetical protein